MSFKVTRQTRDKLLALIDGAGDGDNSVSVSGPRMTRPPVCAVVCGELLDETHKVYSAHTQALDGDALTWTNSPAAVYLWAGGAALTPTQQYMALGAAVRTQDDDTRPLFVVFGPASFGNFSCVDLAVGVPVCDPDTGEISGDTQWIKMPSDWLYESSSDCAEGI